MSAEQLLTVLRVVLIWALSIGAVTVLAQRLLRRASIVVQLCLVVVATVGVLIAGMVGAFNAMFISAHDLEVMWYILAIAAAVAVVVAVVLGVGLARNTKRLTGVARSIGRGETVAPQGKMSAELGALAAELQATSEKLDESRRRVAAVEQARRELVSWVSHDLRTPLASMRAMAEALEDGVATDVSGYHHKIIAQADQMAVLVNDLLELSKIQAGTLELNAARLDLYDLISDAIADLAPLAQRRNISIDGDKVRSTFAAADAASLGRAVRNVILNAILYSREGSTVRIAVWEEAGHDTGGRTGGNNGGPSARVSGRAGGITGGNTGARIYIAVEDECGGIAPEDLPRLFTPGWQRDSGRSKNPLSGAGVFSGAGVGLSMVAGIVQAHGGSVQAENVGDGCRFTLWIPAPDDAASPKPGVPGESSASGVAEVGVPHASGIAEGGVPLASGVAGPAEGRAAIRVPPDAAITAASQGDPL